MSDLFAQRVFTTIAEVKHIPAEKVNASVSLTDLGYDSLDSTVLLFELEKRFAISVPDDYLKSVRTVQDVVNGVAELHARAAERGSTAAHGLVEEEG